MKKIAIRVDSSTQIGSGHLMRCLTLAKKLKKDENADIIFISRNLEGNLNNLVRDQGFELNVLPRHDTKISLAEYENWLTVPQLTDAQETIEILKSLRAVDELIIDSYAIDFNWATKLLLKI